MNSIRELYFQQIETNLEKSPYIQNFIGSPYSYLKARYYMFFSAVLVYFLQKSSVHPNTITKLYILMAFVGGLLLAIPNPISNFLAIFFIFSKGILDWTDGHLARLKGMTSLTGHILDVYGARIHSLTFIIALGIYQYFYLDNNIFFLAALCIYPFCYGTLLTKFSNQYILDSVTPENLKNSKIDSNQIKTIDLKYPRIYKFLVSFLDDRSRTVDLVLLLIVMEQIGGPPLSWLFFVAVNIKWIVLWSGSFIFSSKIDSADQVLASKLGKIKDV